MPRRIELQDAADGISGHIARYAPWEPSSLVHDCLRDSEGEDTEFLFDLIAGTVEPSAKRVKASGPALREDLRRYLARRQISTEWVAAASLHLAVVWPEGDDAAIDIRVRVLIVDDRAIEHTSTRRLSVELREAGLYPRRPRGFEPRPGSFAARARQFFRRGDRLSS